MRHLEEPTPHHPKQGQVEGLGQNPAAVLQSLREASGERLGEKPASRGGSSGSYPVEVVVFAPPSGRGKGTATLGLAAGSRVLDNTSQTATSPPQILKKAQSEQENRGHVGSCGILPTQ